MRTHLNLVLSEHDHPVVEKELLDPEDSEDVYATIKISETTSITGPAEVVFEWIDELHARSQLAR